PVPTRRQELLRQYWQIRRDFFAWLSSPEASKTYHTFQRPGTAMLPRPAPCAVATARAHELRIGTLAAARARRGLDVLHLVERDVAELAADLLHPPDIDRLHHITGIGIDRHRSARAVPLQPLGRRDQGIAVGVATRLLQRLVDGAHAVIAADREEVGVAPVHFVEHLDELDVERSVALVVVMPRRDDAEAGVAHRFERLLRRGLA